MTEGAHSLELAPPSVASRLPPPQRVGEELLWRAPLIRLTLTTLAIFAIFHRDVADMASIWWNSSTYNHCLFLPPIVAWLIWQRRDEVARLTPHGFAPGLVLIAVAGLIWLLGQAGGIALFRHGGVVLMLQACVLTLLGPQVTRGLLFPLFYLVFLVPFGEEFVPALQTLTAKLSMALLGVAGIPAHIEGVFIQTPAGLFEVAEACSGVKFLVAMVAYGALVANVCFRSWPRRIAWMAACVAVPILANGIRAYGIMHISEATSADFAASVDHVIWGWMFFGFVMALTLALGWRFFDRGVDERWLGEWADGARLAPSRREGAGLAVAAICLALVPVAWTAAVARNGRVAVTHAISLPDVPGWRRVPLAQSFPWSPRFDGADHRLLGAYADAKGARVELAVALYGWQQEGKELVGFGQGAFPPESRWSWANDTPPPRGGRGERIFAPGLEREVVSFYIVGGTSTGSSSQVKLETLKARALGGDQAAVAILVSVEGAKMRPAIDAFIAAMGPPEAMAARFVAQARGR